MIKTEKSFAVVVSIMLLGITVLINGFLNLRMQDQIKTLNQQIDTVDFKFKAIEKTIGREEYAFACIAVGDDGELTQCSPERTGLYKVIGDATDKNKKSIDMMAEAMGLEWKEEVVNKEPAGWKPKEKNYVTGDSFRVKA